MSILDETTNFLKLYQYATGRSEVPWEFHFWSAISLIAALVADRVYVSWMKEQPVIPNLYVFLIAPSGIGKNVAANVASQYVLQEPWLENKVNYYRGKLTPPRLHDLLGRKKWVEELGEYVDPNSKIWLLTPELTYGMGKGEMAEQLIETMTELFSCGKIPLKEGTRTHGELVVEDPCINWLAGTTKEWLVDAVKPKGIKGGFFARVMPVYYKSGTPRERLWQPMYPSDYQEVFEYLKLRAQALSFVEGEFKITAVADQYGRQWYYNRKDPEDDNLSPYYNRAREMMLKLAMVFSLADGGPLVIEPHHIQKAHLAYMELQQGTLELIELASQTPQTMGSKAVAEYLMKVGECKRTQLSRAMQKKGLDRKGINDALSLLYECELIESQLDGRATVYRWKG
jgi:hypothetical protein